jgi:hypothetical protein
VKCSAKTKAGASCSANAVRGTKRCFLHTGDGARVVGAKGGRRRARYSTEELTPIDQPKNAGDVMNALAQVFVDVHGGRIEPRVSNALAYLASAYLSALQVADFAARIEALEARQKGETTA